VRDIPSEEHAEANCSAEGSIWGKLRSFGAATASWSQKRAEGSLPLWNSARAFLGELGMCQEASNGMAPSLSRSAACLGETRRVDIRLIEGNSVSRDLVKSMFFYRAYWMLNGLAA
jgi:hypothetical protein